MRILYGVQGTGNGHLSRARAMARALARHPEVTVDWLFSSRPANDFFDMGAFGNYRLRKGISFAVHAGRIDPLATLRHASASEFLGDVRALELDGYDAIVSDFEPVTAWAARVRGRECTGIGHQYAFLPGVPRSRRNPVAGMILDHYAPASTRIGLHWHHFGRPLLPPIVDADARAITAEPGSQALVYLPFEDQARIIAMLQSLPEREFAIFGPGLHASRLRNVVTHPLGRRGFLEALARSSHVICNSGFELISEALHLGKRILSKPLVGQVEQQSNAMALRELGYAETTQSLDSRTVADFLGSEETGTRVAYPDVAAAIAAWLTRRAQSLELLSEQLWRETQAPERVERKPAQADPALRVPGAAVRTAA